MEELRELAELLKGLKPNQQVVEGMMLRHCQQIAAYQKARDEHAEDWPLREECERSVKQLRSQLAEIAGEYARHFR